MKARTEGLMWGALAVSWLCACGPGRAGLVPYPAADGGSAAGPLAPDGSAGTLEPTADGGAGGTAGAGTAAGTRDGGAMDAQGGADAGAAATETPGACSKDGWCWSTPTPQGNPLFSISGSDAADVWAVGESGSIVHWDGQSWTQIPSGATATLRGVFAAGAADAWAVGDDATILRWNGHVWSPASDVPAAGLQLRAVWGTGPDELWIVGGSVSSEGIDSGTILYWNGMGWTVYNFPQSLDAIWGTGSNDVWCLGEAPGLLHWDGRLWSTASTEVPMGPTSIWDSSAQDVWLGTVSVGESGSIVHWDGMSLDVEPGSGPFGINGVWGSGPDDVWAVGVAYPDWYGAGGVIFHWNGAAWDRAPMPATSQLRAVWGSRSDDVWAAGESGEMIHWNGLAWSAPTGPPHANPLSVWASGPDDVWAFGDDQAGLAALHGDGRTWARTDILAMAPSDANDPAFITPFAAWGSGRDDVWIGAVAAEPNRSTNSAGTHTHTLFVHWDGRAWSPDASLDPLVAGSMQVTAMWGNGPKDVWAVGAVYGSTSTTGAAVHWDGARWSAVTSLPAADLADAFHSVWSSGPNDVWIGGDATVHHWDGVAWARPLSASDARDVTVSGSGPGDVWAVAATSDAQAVAWHWNGGAWTRLATPFDYPLGVLAISPTNAWLVGHTGSLSHWNGTAWSLSDAGTDLVRPGLWWDGTETWAVVGQGLIRHP